MTTPDEEANTPDPVVDAPDPVDDDDSTSKPNKSTTGPNEARHYRQRAQTAEAERDALRERVDGLTRSQVERMIEHNQSGLPAPMHDPSDLWSIGGVTVADVTDDDGQPDPEKIRAACLALREARPYLFNTSGDDLLVAALRRQIGPILPPPTTTQAWSDEIKKARSGVV